MIFGVQIEMNFSGQSMQKEPTDEDIRLRANALTRRMVEAKISLITAESCTGGLICAALAQADGAGSALQGGFVVYTKEQKSMALGIPGSLLQKVGSVTPDIARRMAEGALARSSASVALALTGVTGPAEDEDGNPIGRMIFACGTRDKIEVETFEFDEMPPEKMRRCAVLCGLDMLDRQITALKASLLLE